MFFLQASHVIGQVMEQAAKLESSLGGGPAEEHDEVYVCLWAGCKVRGKTSCSKSWLEKHVPTHGGKFNFACMVGGCKQRFTSQVRQRENKRQSESNLGICSWHPPATSIPTFLDCETCRLIYRWAGRGQKIRVKQFPHPLFWFIPPFSSPGPRLGLSLMVV